MKLPTYLHDTHVPTKPGYNMDAQQFTIIPTPEPLSMYGNIENPQDKMCKEEIHTMIMTLPRKLRDSY